MRVDAASSRPTPTTLRPLHPTRVSRDSLAAGRPDRSAQMKRPALRRHEPQKLTDLLTTEEKRFIQRLFPSASTSSAKPYSATETYAPRLGGTIDVRG